jgi:hypothetical protein
MGAVATWPCSCALIEANFIRLPYSLSSNKEKCVNNLLLIKLFLLGKEMVVDKTHNNYLIRRIILMIFVFKPYWLNTF